MNSRDYYSAHAKAYLQYRAAAYWILDPLLDVAASAPRDAPILEIGCGTGNYIIALSEILHGRICWGFDFSAEMLAMAKGRGSSVRFTRGNADHHFPYQSATLSFAFAVDVIHHIKNHHFFFTEAKRVLVPGGLLVIVTDSESDLRSGGLSTFFPETLEPQLSRYPGIGFLEKCGADAGLVVRDTRPVDLQRAITDELVSVLASKSFSAFSYITDEEHRRGMDRVNAAREAGGMWRSCSTILVFSNSKQQAGRPKAQ